MKSRNLKIGEYLNLEDGQGTNSLKQLGSSNQALADLSFTTGEDNIVGETNPNGTLKGITSGGKFYPNGYAGFAEGGKNKVYGRHSHAEGYDNIASGHPSHVEGGHNIASGDVSHAEGQYTISSGIYSHTEGLSTKASGMASHAGGVHTRATVIGQTSLGMANEEDTNALFIVGNGDVAYNASTANYDVVSRKNAFKVLRDGRVTIGKNPTESMDVVTKNYTDEQIRRLVGITPEKLAFTFSDNTFSVAAIDINISGEVVIPKQWKHTNGNWYPVVSIKSRAFLQNNITSIEIPDSVTSIGSSAFYYCSSLTSVVIPNSVTSIGSGAFYTCSSLTSVTIPNSVTSIGDNAFCGCSSLTSVVIGDSVTSIGNSAFYYCSSLTSIVIPNGVTSIGSGAFKNCTKLKSIIIPNSVTSIGDNAFYGCSSLTSVVIGDSVTSIGNDAFSNCSSLEKFYVPSGSLERFNHMLPGTANKIVDIPNSVEWVYKILI